ncbi:MAG: hypothetical protein R3C10_02605 [Pirellulales bacterium]
MMKLLLDSGADPRYKDVAGESAISVAPAKMRDRVERLCSAKSKGIDH